MICGKDSLASSFPVSYHFPVGLGFYPKASPSLKHFYLQSCKVGKNPMFCWYHGEYSQTVTFVFDVSAAKMAEGKANVKTDIQTAELLSGPFENILNFRDVGKTINEFLGEK
jgi:hypothetical protein